MSVLFNFCSLSLFLPPAAPHTFSRAKQHSAGPVATALAIKSIYPQLSGPLVTAWSNKDEAISRSPGPAPPFSLKCQPGGAPDFGQRCPTPLGLLPLPGRGSGCLSFVFLLFGGGALTVHPPQQGFRACLHQGWWVAGRLSHFAGAEQNRLQPLCSPWVKYSTQGPCHRPSPKVNFSLISISIVCCCPDLGPVFSLLPSRIFTLKVRSSQPHTVPDSYWVLRLITETPSISKQFAYFHPSAPFLHPRLSLSSMLVIYRNIFCFI